ncbi:MAG: MBL fold metallo-hydrolase [Candidatus Marsarchaeota archaeon]|nr:MBL fold metallo-hydrolase [Candidatus Marsarchaeota archaeon]MCL5413489.1 MBL fold metallo-hydrolase [Candidatus Marsarchaeota archaeon]
MEIKFLGGAGEVGRSGILVRDEKNILLDYGVKIDEGEEYPIDAGDIDACVISHAHLDHSGYAPHVYSKGMPEMFATDPTIKLSELLIEDSIKIHKKKHMHPHFHREQLKTMLNRYTPCDYGERYPLGRFDISMYDAGHICGSAVTLVEKQNNGRRLVYTGDFKIEQQLLEGGAEIVKSDILILESTYAAGEHPDREEQMKRLAEEVRETVDNGGVALVPVFAVGRSQEMLALMNRYGLIDRTYIDGMAKAATEIVEQYPDYVKNRELLDGGIRKAQWISNPRNRDYALEGGSVVLTTSGMLNGGPVLDYITRLNRNSKIFITGYQVDGTNGKRLLEGKPLNIDGREYRVRHPVSMYDFSAHAGKSDLHRYVKESSPETVICVHGSAENTALLAGDLRMEGFDARAPSVGEVIELGSL